MKKTILLLMILAAGRLFAQEVYTANTPGIIYKVDTIRYVCTYYKVVKDSKVVQLIQKMGGFEIATDNSVSHQGQPVKKIRINGRDYAGLDIKKSLQKISADVVENIEVIDDYGDAAKNSFMDLGPEKVLNINIKKDKTFYPQKLIGDVVFKINDSHTAPNKVFDSLLRKMEGMEVDVAGNVAQNSKTVTKVRLNGNTYDKRDALPSIQNLPATVYTKSEDWKIHPKHIEDRTEPQRNISRQMINLQANIANQGKDINEYGDQVPHFVFKLPLNVMKWYMPVN